MPLSPPTRLKTAQTALALTDLLALNLGFPCALAIVGLWQGGIDRFIPERELESHFSAYFLISLCFVGWCWISLRHYTYRQPFWFELKETLRTLIILSVVYLAVVTLAKWQFSRYLWVYSWITILILVPALRYGVRRVLNRFGIWKQQCIIIGTGNNATDTYNALNRESYLGLDIQYFYATDLKNAPKTLLDIPVLCDEKTLRLRSNRQSTYYLIALDDGDSTQQDYWVRYLATRKCRIVSVVPPLRGIPLNSTGVSFLFRHDLLFLRINNNLSKKSARFVKRTVDIVGSFLLLCLLSPLLGLIAFAIVREDGGSPIYRQQRVGRGGKKFFCLKFRSMMKDAQHLLDQKLESDPQLRQEWEQYRKLKNDPRITRIGCFLRRASLDELPQLWNVLKGEMSLVGPRPIMLDELEYHGENMEYYLIAKPGMTGLWQVSGRNDVDFKTRVYFDVWYVKNWSLWNDIVILFKTIDVVVKKRGVYK